MNELRNGIGCKSLEDRLPYVIAMNSLGPKDFGIGKPVSKAVTVYRVEMPNGNGPYNSGLPNARAIYEKLCAPNPGYDCAFLANVNREICGASDQSFYLRHGDASYCCDSLASLYRWFPLPARKYLKEQGAKIRVYEIPVGEYLAKCGNGECLFNKTTANLVDELSIA